MSLIQHGQHDYHLDLRTEDNTLQIDIKWDGCVNIQRSFNGKTVDEKSDDKDYLHTCDLKEFIEQLQEAYDKAIEIGFEMD